MFLMCFWQAHRDGEKGKYGPSALPSLVGAAAWPGEASWRWSAWELWQMGRGVKAAPAPGWFCSVTCLGSVVVPQLRAPQESPSLLACGARSSLLMCHNPSA